MALAVDVITVSMALYQMCRQLQQKKTRVMLYYLALVLKVGVSYRWQSI